MFEAAIITYAECIKNVGNSMFEVEFKLATKEGNPIIKEVEVLKSNHNYWLNIPFTGTICGDYYLAINKEDWEKIIAKLVSSPEEINNLLPEYLKEFFNAVCGKSIKSLLPYYQDLTISNPRIIKGEIDYPITKIYHCQLEHQNYQQIDAFLCLNLMKQDISRKLETTKLIMKSIADGIIILNFDGIIEDTYINSSINFLNQYENYKHKNIIDIIPYEIIKNEKNAFINWLKSEKEVKRNYLDKILDECPISKEDKFVINNKTYIYKLRLIGEDLNKKLIIVILEAV
ncbi:chemotaxis protein CheX [Candidatus Margulisiibacteriota bacterium]